MQARRSRQVLLLGLAPLATLALAAVGTGSTTGGAVTAAAPEQVREQAVSVTSSPVAGRVAGGNQGSIPNLAQAAMLRSSTVAEIPAGALAAYQRAAQVMDNARPDCHLSWTMLAAVGRIESDHGSKARAGKVFGKVLNGKRGTQLVRDTDAGRVDGNKQFDRAVGPMQMLPATWQVVAVDSDGNGTRDPQDVDDAALGAAVFLCGGSEDLSTKKGQLAALKRYDRAPAFAPLAVRLAKAYAASATPSQLLPAFDATTSVDLPDTVQADMPHSKSLGGAKAKTATSTKSRIHPVPSSPTPTGDGGTTGATPTKPVKPGGGPSTGGNHGGGTTPPTTPPAKPKASPEAATYCTDEGFKGTDETYSSGAARGTYGWCTWQYDKASTEVKTEADAQAACDAKGYKPEVDQAAYDSCVDQTELGNGDDVATAPTPSASPSGATTP